MAGWVLWVIAACAFGLFEALTGRTFLRPWSIGAALAAVVDLAGAGAVLPWLVLIIGSTLARMAMRTIGGFRAKKLATSQPALDPLVGKQAIVLEQIANRYGVGCIELEGEVWTARAYDRDRVIDAGAEVRVVEVRGATALVSDRAARALVSD